MTGGPWGGVHEEGADPFADNVWERRLVLTLASSIRPERQRWLWTDRIPLDALCLLAGREGHGPSQPRCCPH